MAAEADYRLPRTVIPSRYELTLEPDLENATFTGFETVTVDVVESVHGVVLNAIELVVEKAAMVDAAGDTYWADAINYDEDNERVTLVFEEALAPGAWTLQAWSS